MLQRNWLAWLWCNKINTALFINIKSNIMKLKTFLAVAVIALFTACSTTYRASDTGVIISSDATRAFNQQYPTAANVVWNSYNPNLVIINDWDMAGWTVVDADDYVVQFEMDGERYYAWYDTNGEWVGSAYTVNDFATLPDAVRNTINIKYPGYAIDRANKQFHKDRVAYEVILKNADTKQVALIDADGMVIKSKMK